MTIYRINPGTSTKGGTENSGKTNPYRVMFAGYGGNPLRTGVVVRGITVEGYQGHNSHGLTIGYTESLDASDIIIRPGNKGSGSSPPYETFGLEIWHAHNPHVHDCLIDGRYNGVNVAATLFGLNDVDAPTISNITGNYSSNAFGSATWRSGGAQTEPLIYENCNWQYCRRAMNFEQCYGWLEINNCDFTHTLRTSAAPDVTCALAELHYQNPVTNSATMSPAHGLLAGTTQTSMKMTIREPKWDRNRGFPFIVGCVKRGTVYGAANNALTTQKASDITVIIDGVSYTPPASNDDNGAGLVVNSLPGGGSLKIGNYWNG